MGVKIQKDDYTSDSHDATVQMHCERLAADGYVIDDVQTKYGIWLIRDNYTKILYHYGRESDE
jgi:hypothetical protein